MKGFSYVVLHQKDAGARITSIVEDYGVSKYTPVIATLLKNPTLNLPQ